MKGVAFIAAGGTGGHIYPALAIADALKQQQPDLDVHFVGTSKGLENSIIPRAGYPLHHLSIGPLHSSVGSLQRLKTLCLIPLAFFQSLWLLLWYRPRFVLGVGGYASGPMVMVGALTRRPVFLWEPNAVPGLTNRILAPFVTKAFVVFKEAQVRIARSVQAGMPVRKEIENLVDAKRRHPQAPFRLFIFGGSQGAQAINDVVSRWIASHQTVLEHFEIIHQTGRRDFERMQTFYRENGLLGRPELSVVEFVFDMHDKYLWADLVICRSGAGTLAEVAAAGCPALFIPFPYAADDHQKKNAESFVDAKACWMIEQKNLNVETLAEQVDLIFKDISQLEKRSLVLKSLFQRLASEKIVSQIGEFLH